MLQGDKDNLRILELWLVLEAAAEGKSDCVPTYIVGHPAACCYLWIYSEPCSSLVLMESTTESQ